MSALIKSAEDPLVQGTPQVMWLTGLSGAGKTTLARQLVEMLRTEGRQVVHVDGDSVRAMLGDDLGHSPSDRLENAYRISKLCQFLQQQGTMVVCSTMSLYPEIWEWNRKNLSPYTMVYVKVGVDELRKRDQKGLYSGVEEGRCSNVVGIDLPFNEPRQACLTLRNENIEEQKINLMRLYEFVRRDDYETR